MGYKYTLEGICETHPILVKLYQTCPIVRAGLISYIQQDFRREEYVPQGNTTLEEALVEIIVALEESRERIFNQLFDKLTTGVGVQVMERKEDVR